jgi:hypothetical protein
MSKALNMRGSGNRTRGKGKMERRSTEFDCCLLCSHLSAVPLVVTSTIAVCWQRESLMNTASVACSSCKISVHSCTAASA